MPNVASPTSAPARAPSPLPLRVNGRAATSSLPIFPATRSRSRATTPSACNSATSSSARAALRSGGWLLLEHGYDQGAAVHCLLTSLDYRAVATHRDHADNDRVTLGRRDCHHDCTAAPAAGQSTAPSCPAAAGAGGMRADRQPRRGARAVLSRRQCRDRAATSVRDGPRAADRGAAPHARARRGAVRHLPFAPALAALTFSHRPRTSSLSRGDLHHRLWIGCLYEVDG